MIDIVDVVLARALTPQGAVEQYAAQAGKAVSDANTAVTAANDAVAVAEAASQSAQEAAAELEELSTNLNTTIENIAEEKISDAMENVVNEVAVEDENTSSYKSKKVRVRKKGIDTYYNLMKHYSSTGQHEDGGMTQKAITNAIEQAKQSSGGGSTNLGPENEGQVVVIGSDGNIKPGDVSEDTIIESLIGSGTYTAKDAVGLEIDYANKNFNRIQEASNLVSGSDFNKYPMYGGRRRCIVNSNGQIVAWYGDNNYAEDGSIGQVMIYQPKFYYNRAILNSENSDNGKIIRKETIMISATPQAGFKLHPLFKDENGNEIDYVLLSAYESTYFDVSANSIITNDAAEIDTTEDYLLSVSGVKPISGVNKTFTVEVAEQMAKNIGQGWHITNMAAESANQMLSMIEFGQMNGQNALELGVVNFDYSKTVNGASITGSTSMLGNNTGHATATVNEYNGVYTTYQENGKRAISYRGFENPWGNIYRFIGGINLTNDGTLSGGMPYVASDYNYTSTLNGSNYSNIGFKLPGTTDWISAMGYGKPEYDWIYLPIEAINASSLLPVGDFLWTSNNFTGINLINIGGTNRQKDSCGLFYYGCDIVNNRSSAAFSARIMHIPTKNSSIYNANITSWHQQVGA